MQLYFNNWTIAGSRFHGRPGYGFLLSVGRCHDVIRIVIGIIEFHDSTWERSVDYSRCFQESNRGGIRFLFFLFGFSRIRSSFVGSFISRGRRRFLSWSRRKNFTVYGLGCEAIQGLVPISAVTPIGFFLFPVPININLVNTLKGLFNTKPKGILPVVIPILCGYSGVLLLIILILARSRVLRSRTGPFFGVFPSMPQLQYERFVG